MREQTVSTFVCWWLTGILTSTALVAKRPNNIIAMAGDMGWSDIGYYGGRTGEELKAEGK